MTKPDARPSPAPGQTDEGAIEHLILAQTRLGALKPLARIMFDGIAREVDAVMLPERHRPQAEQEIVTRIVGENAPLEYFYYRAKKPIEPWQYLAGARFRLDHYRAKVGQVRAVDPERASLYVTDRSRAHARAGDPLRASPRYGNTPDIADGRLDAIRRLGALADAISVLGFWMLTHMVGDDWSARAVAAALGEDERYVNGRFREALVEAAGHYRLMPSARPARPRAHPPLRNFDRLTVPETYNEES